MRRARARLLRLGFGYLFRIPTFGEAGTGFEFSVLAVTDEHFSFSAFVAFLAGFFRRGSHLFIFFQDILAVRKIRTSCKVTVSSAFNDHFSDAAFFTLI